ncbi:MAG: hypothetical protein DMG22_02955 [Acidobacteria bacterium]|nr:MAG: hypothetical protein DMG22_02955 [Acidobacteriota bacterium]
MKQALLVPLFFPLAAFCSVWLSRAMTMVSAVIACSGVFLPYSRRATGVWVACGSLMLALLWMFDVVVA